MSTEYLDNLSRSFREAPNISNFRESLLDFNGFLFKESLKEEVSLEEISEKFEQLKSSFDDLFSKIKEGKK